MVKARLDQTDINILKELQKNGKVTNLALAKTVSISAPSCLRRVRALEEAGIIKKYVAKFDEKSLGFNFTSLVFISLSKQSEQDLDNFKEYVQNFDQIRECYMTSGKDDFVLKCLSQDWDMFQKFITDHLVSAPNVKTVKTSPIIQNCKEGDWIPL